MWAHGASMLAICAALGMSKEHLSVKMLKMRERGWDLPYRRAKAPWRAVGASEKARALANAANRERQRRDREDRPEFVAAHRAVENALKKGALVRPAACNSCLRAGPVVGHHNDYSKPLEVEWLCRLCHGRIHNPS